MTAITYGYIRVSSVDQNTYRQHSALLDNGITPKNIYTDKLSGKNTDRPALADLLSRLREGDTLVVHSLDRLARNTVDCIELIQSLATKGIGFTCLKEGSLNFSAGNSHSSGQTLILTILSAVAQLERSLIKERQAEGIAARKAKGLPTGRPSADTAKLTEVDSLVEKGVSLNLACKQAGIGRSTYYRLRQQGK